MKKIAGYFFQGLLLTVPIAATVYVLYYLFLLIDGLLDGFLPQEIKIPGLGFLIIFSVITLLGYLGSFYFANPIFSFTERIIERAPLVKLIYTSVKDMVNAFVGEKKRFNHPVVVTLKKNPDIQQIGFITQSDLSALGLGKEKVAVYFPFSYSFAGTLLIVPGENISPLDASGTDMIKFVISGGVTEI